MLQFVLFDIGESLPAGIDSLFQEFTQETIPFACYSETSASLFISDNRQTFMPVTALEKKMFFLDNIRQKYIVQQKDCLLITHSPEFAECARKQGYVCFGYTTTESSVRFPSLPLVLEGFEEVSLSFLQREFAHALREPAFICKTNRCNIQELSLTDVPFLYKMMQQESQVHTCTSSDTTTGQNPVVFLREPLGTLQEELEKQEAYIQYVYPFSYFGIWGIYLKETGQLIGRIGITETMLHNEPEYVLEYFIQAEHRGSGYATECVNAVLRYVQEFETDSVCVCIHIHNTASLRVLSHCTFPYEEIQAEQNNIRCFRIYLTK